MAQQRKSGQTPRRGQPPTGKVPITYRYQPNLPVYQHLQAEAERFGTTLQEEMHRALVDWYTGDGRLSPSIGTEDKTVEHDARMSLGAQVAAESFM